MARLKLLVLAARSGFICSTGREGGAGCEFPGGSMREEYAGGGSFGWLWEVRALVG